MSDPKSNRGYVDTNYLRVVGEWMAQVKETTYDLMNIRYGHQVLDVGCGPASDTLAIAEIVGPAGKVIGIDYDKEMVQVANEKAQEANVSDYVTHKVADATEMPFADDSFHAVRSERVLQHIIDPIPVIAEMVRVTKPDGWVVNADADWSWVTFDIPYKELEWKLRRLYCEYGNNSLVGRQLYRLMKQAGLTDVHIRAITLPITQYELWKISVSFEDKLIPRGIESGIWTEEEVRDLVHLLEKRDKEGLFFVMDTILVVAGKKSNRD
jgi:ubiquinone/menaquinone biosynthesis C-methylase UbiE